MKQHLIASKYYYSQNEHKMILKLLIKIKLNDYREIVEYDKTIDYSFSYDEIKEIAGEENVESLLQKIATRTILVENYGIKINAAIFSSIEINKEEICFSLLSNIKNSIFEKFQVQKLSQYDFNYIVFSNSKYAVTLFNEFQNKVYYTIDQIDFFKLKFELDELTRILESPQNYKYGKFKQVVLEIIKKEFLNFEYDNSKLFREFYFEEEFDSINKKGRNSVKSITFYFSVDNLILQMAEFRKIKNIMIETKEMSENMIEQIKKERQEQNQLLNRLFSK